MKRTLSLFVVVVMLVSMFSFMTTGVSANILKSTYEDAKDGDLLYEVKFGQTTGAYTPEIFKASKEGDAVLDKAVVVSDNGRTLAFHKPGIESGTFWYGGKIDGLTWGGDKVYTITMELSLPAKRGGVYFNFPTDTHKETLKGTSGTNLDNNYASVMYGLYGRFDGSGDMGSMISGGKIAGRYRFDTSSYKEFESIIVETGTFLEVTYLVEGYTYAIFVNGNFLDIIDLTEEAVKGISDQLGFSVYLYHFDENVPMIVKNVNVYKGDIIASKATYPAYASSYPKYIPAATTTAAPTTPKVTTKAPDKTTPVVTTTAAPDTTTKASDVTTAPVENKGGCGSAVASGLALVALVSLAGVAVAKKRK